MQTHRTNGPLMPGTSMTLRELEAPAVEGRIFLGGSGWLGFRCGCGFTVSARTPAAIQAAITAHEEPDTCPFAAAKAVREDEAAIDQ